MKNKIRRIPFLLVLTALLLTACASVPNVDWELSIKGDVANPLTISYKELARKQQVELKDILMNKSIGEDTIGSWSGVALEDLLIEAGAEENFVSITAVAGDGYAIEISRDELENAIVALKENGEWIQENDPGHGPIRLVCPQTPANRWVFQLIEIQVNK